MVFKGFDKNCVNGFVLVSTIVALSVLSLSMMSFLSLMDRHNKETKNLSHQLVGQSLDSFLSNVMRGVGSCSCHFDSSINREVPAESLGLNTDTLDDIGLRTLRVGCDFNSTENIVAQVGVPIVSGENLVVSKIRLSEIQPIEGAIDRYSGELLLDYGSEGEGIAAFRPISIPLTFSIDSNLGSPDSRPIVSCWESTGGIGVTVGDCYRADHSVGRTLVGCGGTASEDIVRNTTAFGFEAGIGGGGLNGPNTYFGYQSGRNHSGNFSTFLGFQAGKDSGSSQRNTFIGYKAGLNSKGSDQVFVGSEAGRDTTTGERNTFLGAFSGSENQIGSDNLFVGYESGLRGVSSQKNVFIGHQSGRERDTGERNVLLGSKSGRSLRGGSGSVFLGYQAGFLNSHEERSVFIGESAGLESNGGEENVIVGRLAGRQNTGSQNTFVGTGSGFLNQAGEDNVFLGFNSGFYNAQASYSTFAGVESGYRNVSGTHNVFIGQRAGFSNINGVSNTMVGAGAGYSMTNGSHNIFIGYNAGRVSNYNLVNHKFVVGNGDNPDWLTGDITSTGNLYVNGQPVVITSSRALKKKIKVIEGEASYLEALLKTPLFTYYYKSPFSHPEKERMGIISERLPKYLQIQEKGRLSRPDWPSIYGYFWAGIKALYKGIQKLRIELQAVIQPLQMQLREFQESYEKVVREFVKSQRELSEVKVKLRVVHKEIEETREEIRLLTRRIKEKRFARSSKLPGLPVRSSSSLSREEGNLVVPVAKVSSLFKRHKGFHDEKKEE